MKNITVAIDDETYRKARVAAAERDSSVSALVRSYLTSLTSESARDLKREQKTLLDSLWRRHPGFTATENLDRDALYRQP